MKPTYRVDDLLGTRSRVAVLRVLHGVDVPLNASQIAARTGFTQPAVASVLADLSSMGIVRSSPAGRATVHWLSRDNVYVENLIDPLFHAERSIPDDLVDKLALAFQDLAISVVLFGSYARGDQTPASDVDIVLVASSSPRKAVLEKAAADHASAFRSRFGATLSYLVYTQEEAAALSITSSELAESIGRDGVVVSGLSSWEWADDATAC
jgi:predicted nucleotidyltransferase